MTSRRRQTTNSQPSSADRFERFFAFIGFRLEDFQKEIVSELFAGRRESLILLPRGNGKSSLLAALALFHLLTRPDAKVAIGAASREQAQTLFDMARSMASNPQIARQVTITRREIRTETGWMKVIASDGPKQHGLVVTLAIVDELHAHHDDELYIALRTGLLKRPDAQMWTISTAGIGEESALGLLHARAKQGKIERNGFVRSVGKNLGMLEWALPDDANVDDMKVVKSVNPASWLDEGVLAEQREAVHDIAFRRYHCNQWVAAEAPWITGDVWDACKAKPKLDPERKTILGVDASIRHDSTVVATVQRTEDGTFHAVFKAWVPTRGHEVKMEIVVEHIRQQCKEWNVTGVCFDPYFMHHAAQILEDEGVPMIEWKQDNARMVPATRTLHEAVVSGKLRHGGDPIARSHALAGEVVETERGIRIKKTAGSGPNDSLVALAMAVEWASRQDTPRRSVYDDRSLVSA